MLRISPEVKQRGPARGGRWARRKDSNDQGFLLIKHQARKILDRNTARTYDSRRAGTYYNHSRKTISTPVMNNKLFITAAIIFLAAIANIGLSADHEYFPPDESSGGWRKNTSDEFIQSLGFIPEKLEEFGRYNLSVPNSNWKPYADYKGILVIKDGWIIGEWYNTEEASNFETYLSSNGKAFTLVCFGIMAGDSQDGSIPIDINSDSRLYREEWLPQGFPLSDQRKSEITFEQVFRHTSGLCPERTGDGDPVEKGRNQWTDYVDWLVGHDQKWPQTGQLYFSPGHAEDYDRKKIDGDHAIAYSSVAMGHLGIIFQNVYSKPASRFLWDRLLEPIGFSGIDFHEPPSDSIKWFSAGGLRMTPRDYARFAYFLLNDGKWGGNQIVAEKWIRKFRSSPSYANIRSNSDGIFGEQYPADMFRIAGSGVNIAFIIPSMDLIALRTGRVSNSRWEEIESTFLEKLFEAIGED